MCKMSKWLAELLVLSCKIEQFKIAKLKIRTIRYKRTDWPKIKKGFTLKNKQITQQSLYNSASIVFYIKKESVWFITG